MPFEIECVICWDDECKKARGRFSECAFMYALAYFRSTGCIHLHSGEAWHPRFIAGYVRSLPFLVAMITMYQVVIPMSTPGTKQRPLTFVEAMLFLRYIEFHDSKLVVQPAILLYEYFATLCFLHATTHLAMLVYSSVSDWSTSSCISHIWTRNFNVGQLCKVSCVTVVGCGKGEAGRPAPKVL